MNDGKIIYAITTGTYSDYCIRALTTDKERAEFLKKYYSSGYDNAEIEEFLDGDPNIGTPELKEVFVIRRIGHGSEYVWECARIYYTYLPNFQNRFFNNLIDKRSIPFLFGSSLLSLNQSSGSYYNDQIQFVAHIVAKDYDHAMKIAMDEFSKQMSDYMGL